MSGKRTTAYFAFSAASRESAKAALVAAGSPAGVADVAKVLGERWRGLSEEDKKVRVRVRGLWAQRWGVRGGAARERSRELFGGECV